MVLAIMLIVMLPLYCLIGKRILYNIPIGEKIFLFQNDYPHISLNKSELLYHLLLAFPSQNILINNVNHLNLYLSCKLSKFKYFHILLWCVHQCTTHGYSWYFYYANAHLCYNTEPKLTTLTQHLHTD